MLQLASVTSVRLIQFNKFPQCDEKHSKSVAAQGRAANGSSPTDQTPKVNSFEEAIANIHVFVWGRDNA